MTESSSPLAAAIPPESLRGRVALVTGGSSGIGLAIARAFGRAGAAVTVTGRRRQVAEDAAEELRQGDAEARAVAGDVARPEDAARMVEETVQAFGGLHVVVNNAGIARAGALEDTSLGDVDAVVDIDLKGPIYVTRAALPHLRKHREEGTAAIVNISSSVTVNPVPNFSVYSAAKAGVEMLTRCWALDFAADRIRVNAIAPGIVATPIFETMMPAEATAGALEGFAAATPLGRVGEPEDVARLALFLAGPAAAWLTGAVIPLDGGLSLGSPAS